MNRKVRIDGIQKNAEWLSEHDLDEEPVEAAKRIGLIEGDAAALKRSLDADWQAAFEDEATNAEDSLMKAIAQLATRKDSEDSEQ